MRRLLPLVSVALVLVPIVRAEGEPAEPGFRALSGPEARAFDVPADMKLVRSLSLPNGLTYQRFQQVVGGAEVLGGQLSVLRDVRGGVRTVTGSHYPNVLIRNSVGVSRAAAARAAARDVGAADRRIVRLRVDPQRGTYFYEVESRDLASRWIHIVDAQSGRILRRIDALAEAHGTGVRRDTKDMNGPNNSIAADDLTKYHGRAGHGRNAPHWDLFSRDNRQRTYDARNGDGSFLYYATDADNHWTRVTSNRRSPGHPALVDAQFYANKTDDFFLARLGFNWKDCYLRMESVAHFGINDVNAFWTGDFVVYGDGDGVVARELSGGVDVVAHELTHGLTDCTSSLIYSGESGALNESFSDMMSASAEFFAAEPLKSKCVVTSGQTACADWSLGEDVFLFSDTIPGERNLADPREDDDPDHYDERYTGTADNGGIHTNSGIPNHAYYLLVNGGQNAGCDTTGSNGHTHTEDCSVIVEEGIGRGKAEDIFFLGFIALPENATMCQARKATEVQAAALFSAGSAEALATTAAWDAVGVPTAC